MAQTFRLSGERRLEPSVKSSIREVPGARRWRVVTRSGRTSPCSTGPVPPEHRRVRLMLLYGMTFPVLVTSRGRDELFSVTIALMWDLHEAARDQGVAWVEVDLLAAINELELGPWRHVGRKRGSIGLPFTVRCTLLDLMMTELLRVTPGLGARVAVAKGPNLAERRRTPGPARGLARPRGVSFGTRVAPAPCSARARTALSGLRPSEGRCPSRSPRHCSTPSPGADTRRGKGSPAACTR